MKLKPSKFHNNRKFYNWLVYEIGDTYIEKDIDKISGTLYDLGCGEKTYEQYFLQYCEKYIGVDWSATQHSLKANIIADLNKPLPILNEVADTIISFSVLEHLSAPQVMLSEAYRILKPQGYFLLRVPFMYQVHEEPHDFYRYTKYGLKFLYQNAGFTEVRIDATTNFWTTCLIKLNYQLIRLITGNKYKASVVKAIIYPITYVNQFLAKILDRIWPYTDKETLAYWVVARK